MDAQLDEELIPESLRDVYRKVYTSFASVEEERAKLALLAVLRAVETDVVSARREANERSNVVPFKRHEADQGTAGLARSR